MEWKRTNRADEWMAQGEKGDFLIWKNGRKWKGRYRHILCQNPKFFLWADTLKDMKKMCENNAYWER